MSWVMLTFTYEKDYKVVDKNWLCDSYGEKLLSVYHSSQLHFQNFTVKE